MMLKKVLIPALCATAFIMAAGVWAHGATAAKAAPASQDAAIESMDQRALDTLKLMSDTVSKAKTVRFQARSMVPVKTPDGIWINLYGTSQVVMQGPDKLFVSTSGDFARDELYFDGKTIIKYSPDKNLYAVKNLPGTIDDVIDKGYEEEDRSFPYADILISEPYAAMTDDLVSALYVGQSILMPLSGQKGVKTDHLAFENEEVQWQVWIGYDDHLPRLVVATYLDDVSEPSYTVEFGDWNLNEPVDAATFAFNNTSNAAKIEFRNPTPPGNKKAAKGGQS